MNLRRRLQCLIWRANFVVSCFARNPCGYVRLHNRAWKSDEVCPLLNETSSGGPWPSMIATSTSLPLYLEEIRELTAASHEARVINAADLGTDPDDEQSMVRPLVCANECDIEGVIVSTGCWKKTQSNTKMLDKIVDAYGKCVDSLKVHAVGFQALIQVATVGRIAMSQTMMRSPIAIGQFPQGETGPTRDPIVLSCTS